MEGLLDQLNVGLDKLTDYEAKQAEQGLKERYLEVLSLRDEMIDSDIAKALDTQLFVIGAHLLTYSHQISITHCFTKDISVYTGIDKAISDLYHRLCSDESGGNQHD